MARRLSSLLTLPRLVVALTFAVVFPHVNLADPDYFWHLETGDLIVAQAALPAADDFSYTRTGADWILHEWLFQVVLSVVHRSAGDLGIRLLVAGLATVAFALTYAATRQASGRPLLSALLVLWPVLLSLEWLSPRPQLVTYALLALTMLLVVRWKYGDSSRALAILPVAMALWVNLHGGYVAGLVLLGLAVGLEWLRRLTHPERALAREPLRWAAMALLATAAASLLSPYGIAHWSYPFEVSSMEASRRFIVEWQSPDFQEAASMKLLVALFLWVSALVVARRRPDGTELGLPLAFIALALVSQRHTVPAALVALPFLGAALREGLAFPPRVAAMLGRLHRDRSDPPGWQGPANWAVLALVAVGLVLFHPRIEERDRERLAEAMPVGATTFLEAHGLSGRMFNTYGWGGYLIRRLHPRQRVFIDGRADLYGDDMVRRYVRIHAGRPGWRRELDGHGVDFAVIGPSAPIRQLLLQAPDFALVYDDRVASILVRRVPRFSSMIDRFERPSAAGAAAGVIEP